MSTQKMNNFKLTDKSDQSCIVCYRHVKYYSVGICEHSVCFECSSRMRVLMEQNECPICRHSVEHVIFTRALRPYKELKEKLRMFIMIPQYGVYIEDEDIKYDFDCLLEHRCEMCTDRPCFRDFQALRSHIQRTHDLFACDLCVENIKHFSRERKYYTRADLAYHKRKGDKKDTSHRGHPLCKFCEKRYFDADELFKHLRKDHFFCHFCDADGLNHFYDCYEELRVHFRCEHFLCEEEHCRDEQFTSVFRSEIDLKAHLAAAHSRLLGRHGTKQARTLDVEFTLAPRPEDERRKQRFQHRIQRERDEPPEAEQAIAAAALPPPRLEKPEIDTDSAKEFPSLAGAPSMTPQLNGVTQSIAQKVALRSGMNVKNKPMKQWNSKVTGSNRHEEEFPALGDCPVSPTLPTKFRPPAPRVVKIPVKKAPVEDFPSLPTSTKSVKKPAWTPKPKPEPGRGKKPVEAPDLTLKARQEDFNFIALPTGRKKEKNNNNLSSVPVENIEPPSVVVEKKGKKKKNQNIVAATALFNGGGSTVAEVRDKKRAEIKSLTGDEFPSLGNSSKRITSAPPGFESSSSRPPGFEKFEAVPNRTCFEPLDPSWSESFKSLYIQPPNFSQRNQNLREAIRTSLNSDEASCDVFRAVSNQYRKGELAAKEYYELCRDMFGMTDFRILFLELLALLPDIKKQQELLMAHRIPGGSMTGLSSCHACGQVLKSSDVTVHVQSHAEDFPSLGAGTK